VPWLLLLPISNGVGIKRSDDGDPLATVVEHLSSQLGKLQAEMTAQLHAQGQKIAALEGKSFSLSSSVQRAPGTLE